MTARGTTPPALPWWERLEAIRLERGWSRTQLAKKAGVARSTVDGWKTNPRPPFVTTIAEVADRLGVDRQDAFRLAGLTGETVPADAPQRRAAPSAAEAERDKWVRAMREDPELLAEFAALLARAQGLIERVERDDPGAPEGGEATGSSKG